MNIKEIGTAVRWEDYHAPTNDTVVVTGIVADIKDNCYIISVQEIKTKKSNKKMNRRELLKFPSLTACKIDFSELNEKEVMIEK